MSNAITHWSVLYNNPFILSPIIVEFYSTYPIKPQSILLSYLILPLTLHPTTRSALMHTNSTSSLVTFTRKDERLIGLPQRIQDYKILTQTCLQHAVDSIAIEINDNLSIACILRSWKIAQSPKDSIRAARNLAKLLAPYDVPTVYRLFGVKEI